ncbi:hypothetical protein D3C84_1097760 [compost metagenome]
MLDSLDAIHVASGNRMQHRQAGRMCRIAITLTQCGQNFIWARQAAGGTDGHCVAVVDQVRSLFSSDELFHKSLRRIEFEMAALKSGCRLNV